MLGSRMTPGVPSGGREVKTKRVSTGSIVATGQADVAVAWDEPFLDTNYTVVASLLYDVAGESLRVRRIRSITAAGCVVNVVNNAALGSDTGVVHVIAIPD